MYNSTTAKWVHFLQLVLCCALGTSAYAQEDTENPCDTTGRYLYWTGEQNNDFFNEKNWRITVEKPSGPNINGEPVKPTCLPGSNSYLYVICPNQPDLEKDRHPKAGTLEPGAPIRYNLWVESASLTANGAIRFDCAQKGITLIHSQLNVTQGTVTQGVVTMYDESTVHLRQGDLTSQVSLNFLDAASWVYLHQDNPDELASKLGNILINHVSGVLDNNFRVNQYYQKGAVIRPISPSFSAMKIFSAAAQQGSLAELREDIIYTGASIPEGMDNATSSFILKRGYMATFAINNNGTGKSKVYIASEADLEVDAMDPALQGNISFIRVVPWNWVTKKGTGGFYNQLDAGWFYNWNFTNNPQPNYEYVPMAWGASGALPSALNQMMQKKKTTHVLGFNESDNCEDQSGKFNNLCQPAVAVAYYENLMSLGLRLGTPAPRENGPTGWLQEFSRLAKEKDVRFDFVAVHWYDWGSNPANSPNADPQQIFNRFKAYLENVHRIYKLPIWITEFNANPNRGNAIQAAFLQLALPYLESLDYVERYAYFQPNPQYAQNRVETANYLDANGALTNIGELYKNHVSTASIPEATLECANNLGGLDQPFVSRPTNTLVYEAECGKYIGNQWDILEQAAASNGLYIQGNTNLSGATALARQVHFEFELAGAGTYRAWIRAASVGTGSIRIRIDGREMEQITPFASSSFVWFQVPRFYDLGDGKHRLTIEFPNANILLDQVAITSGPENLDQFVKESGYCIPSTLKWGLEATDYIGFQEAESATRGISWTTETSLNAIGGAYAASEENAVSAEIPEGGDKVLTFNINVDKSDEYEIWAKIQAFHPSATSLWISVDDEPFQKWNNLGNNIYEWYWKKFHYSYGAEDRSFTHFLAVGQHQVKIAIASGHINVDRLAVASKGKLPETVDPNVLLITKNLEFEAEHATILGAATIVNCATSSNGKQVNMFNLNTNGVRFSEIVAEEAGPYKLKVSYMSAALRSFRVIVNGTILGRQNPPVSGAWCFNAGRPAIYEVDVVLKRGINTIDITPFSGDAPFIDKIKLEKATLNGLSLEAETAEFLGTNSLVNCATASNGALVNMGSNAGNGLRYNNLLAPEGKGYLVDVHYISKVDRNMSFSVNGQELPVQTFAATGNWCYEGGTTRVKTVEVNFLQGNNVIEFRPVGTDVPFIDKIVLREAEPMASAMVTPQEETAVAMNSQLADNGLQGFEIYPNPVMSGAPVTLSLPAIKYGRSQVFIQITDATGRVVYAQNLGQGSSRQVTLDKRLGKGLFFVTLMQGSSRSSKKLIVQ
ncbi:glycosyl hydrolase [Flavihumibacter stibioxidans]|uniref:CBM6 domain-containing protein n=1 Tax=Flavihumibacter stibioxidans TaxID=1834163 RepID=A0ABR7M5U1_9BACT|nr:glycosyl hydrolase [Flavihumibacter stibioxidans]MBC6490393.1 hypothetical protein [Flavihumibacter stibioxidans]